MYAETTYCDVGYCLADPKGGFAFQPPRTVISERDKPLGKRAIQNCPAVNSIERQLVEMPSPIGIRLTLDTDGASPELEVIPTGTFVQPEQIGKMITQEPPERWRHPKMPVCRSHCRSFSSPTRRGWFRSFRRSSARPRSST